MTTDGGTNLLVKGLTVDAPGVNLANGSGWIFGTGFTNKIAMDCHVTCGDLDLNSGGIFGGSNTGFVVATGCSVVCGNIANGGYGGSGGICGGSNGIGETATISITDCSATITGSVTNAANMFGGGGGMCGGRNGAGDGGSATITITGCTATIGGSVTNGLNGGGGGMCGGLNGLEGGTATITITGCTATIGGSVTNKWGGGGGGMCGGLNEGFAVITITNCYASITGSVTNEYMGGGGGMCGGKNFGIISITNCYAEISGDIKFGSILGADMVNITLIPYSPYDLSLNGTILGWIGGVDVNYNIYVGGTLRDLSDITGLSADISTQLLYGTNFTIKTLYNGNESSVSNTVIYLASPAAVVPCFLANAPVLTPTGYTKISKLSAGDNIMTGDGRVVAIQKVSHTRVAAGPSVNPYVIPKGLYGATRRLLISPDHRVSTANGMLEARLLGLEQEEMAGEIDYYNLELPSWSQDTMVVAGVVVESLAPVRRITMTLGAFKKALVAQYGALTPAVLAKVQKTCRLLADGRVECPVLPKN